VVGVLQDREAAQNLAGLQHLPADAGDHMLQAHRVRIGVIALRAGEFPESDGHHLNQPALDLAGKIGMPFDAAHQHHAVALVGQLVHERFDPVGGLAERDHLELADHRTAHRGLRDPVMGQHVRLALRRRRAVAAHRREDERLHAGLLPVPHHAVHDGRDVGNAAAANADGDACSRFELRRERARCQLAVDLGRYICDPVRGKILADDHQAGKVHDGFYFKAGLGFPVDVQCC